jgi:photosystem II stability/assembly factor-like uncharacterized protein
MNSHRTYGRGVVQSIDERERGFPLVTTEWATDQQEGRAVRRWLIFAVAILATVSGSPPLKACDRGGWANFYCPSEEVDAFFSASNGYEYDGNWGFPRSVSVCSYDAECFPWKSANGRYLLFGSINLNGPPRPGHQGNWDIYISEYDSVNQRWGEPVNAGPNINTYTAERRPCCTADCDTLYFDRNDSIFVSTRDSSGWTVAEPLPYPVNLVAQTRHPAISADSRRLYFTSDRSGGHGGRDIWVAKWNGSSWDSVTNVGLPINTPNEETRPFESFDKQRLYFSNNHGAPRPGPSYGGASDIYVSTWTGSGWGPVTLVSAPVNSGLTACSPYESPDGSEIWFGSEAWEGGRGDEDIWVATKGNSCPPRETEGYGSWVKAGELLNAIYVYDLKEDAEGVIYAATACADSAPTGRVFKTNDGGLTWIPCGDLPGAMVVYSLVVQGDTIYAGTYPNGDVFKSVDRGDLWANTADIPGATAARSLVRLHNGHVLAGTSPYDVASRNRIFRTADGGLSWVEVAALTGINPCKFLYQISNGSIFAGGWGIDSEVMVYRSTDDGSTWDSIGVISGWEAEWTADGFYETGGGILYVTGWFPAESPGVDGGYVCRSEDGGDHWVRCEKIMRGDGVHSGRVYAAVEDTLDIVYVGMQPAPDSVVFASADAGTTWFSTGGLEGAFECLCLLRASDGTIYAGTTPNGDVFRYTCKAGVGRDDPAGPLDCRVFQNRPNPFGSESLIRFRLSQACHVTIKVYDVLGRHVKTLVSDHLGPGCHFATFAGIDDYGNRLSSGVYIYRMEAGEFRSVKKAVFLR